MILRQASWAQGLSAGVASASVSPVMELVMALSDQRVQREVVWSLKRGLRDARSEFSFVRVRGFNALAKFMASAVNSEKLVELFRDSQSCRELQVVPVLFGYTLAPRKRKLPKNNNMNNNNINIGVEEVESAPTSAEVESAPTSAEVESAPTSAEVVVALRVLEGCCLLYSGCRTMASCHAAVSELIDLFLAGGPSVQVPCLDGLLAVMLESPLNQKEFERVHGLRKIAEMMRNSHLDPDIRLRIAEFIVILISQILPSEDGPKPAWMTKWAQQELVELLGEDTRAIVDEIMDHRSLNHQGQQSAMLGYAQKLLHLAS